MSAIVGKNVHNDLDKLGIKELPISVEQDFRKEFVCPEESMRYAGSLEQLVFNRFRNSQSKPTIIEFGSGTGVAIIAAILNSKFKGTIHGYEISKEACETADRLIEENELSEQYVIHNQSFFESNRIPQADYLIANPPYIPCDDSAFLILPGLCGGAAGNDVSKKLLSCGYENVFLEVSSYSDPASLIEHAISLEYKIPDFQITQMPFGIYSRQDIVQKRIHAMRESGKAFFSDQCYLVGSAFFTKTQNDEADLSAEFLCCLNSLGRLQK